MLRGIPFVDLAYLKKRDIEGNVPTYRRRKTGRNADRNSSARSNETDQAIHEYPHPASPYLFR